MIKLWNKRSIINYLLLPFAFIWWLVTTIKLTNKGRVFKSLIVCVGNISVGGGGKTPFTIFLFKELQKLNFKVAILSKGYGARSNKRPLLVNPKLHSPIMVGDEAFLMSETAPVVVSKSRKLGISFLESLGFDVILMDDGFQNHTVYKDINILLFNTLNPFGNGFIIPAGPLRESLNSAVKRADIVIGVGGENIFLANLINSYRLKYLNAKINISSDEHNLSLKYLAFAGIAYPEKFFYTLRKHGFKIELSKSFKDHYVYTDTDIQNLISLANKFNLKLITTSKDYVKIKPKFYKYIDNLKINIYLDDNAKNDIIKLIVAKYNEKNNI